MFLRLLLVIAAALMAVLAAADEVPPAARPVVPDRTLAEPAPAMPTLHITPEVAASSVASGTVNVISPEIVEEAVTGTIRAVVRVAPVNLRLKGSTRRQGIEGAIGRRLLPGVSITAP